MPQEPSFNRYQILTFYPAISTQESWWLFGTTQEQWYDRARMERTRMSNTREAAQITPRCLDDLK